eukprot:2614314-Amphidinium_carterae.1
MTLETNNEAQLQEVNNQQSTNGSGKHGRLFLPVRWDGQEKRRNKLLNPRRIAQCNPNHRNTGMPIMPGCPLWAI